MTLKEAIRNRLYGKIYNINNCSYELVFRTKYIDMRGSDMVEIPTFKVINTKEVLSEHEFNILYRQFEDIEEC